MYFGQALNCIRVLTRIIPVLLESNVKTEDAFVERLCWSVEDEETQHGDDSDAPEPLARLVVQAAMHLLFLPGFSVDASAFDDEADGDADGAHDSAPGVPQNALWAAGIGDFEARPVQSSSFDRNRIEVLRLLLTTLCEPLFQSAEAYDPWRSRWSAVATGRDVPNAKLLFYSLLNVIFAYDPTGYGLPYGGALASDAPTQLVTVSSQVAIALLDYGEPAAPEAAAKATSARESDVGACNVFRELLADLSGDDVFDFAFEGLARLLNNVHEALNTTLPGSLQQIECYQEILVLLWKLLEENPGFMPYMLRNCDVTRLVVPVCFLQYQARRDPARVGLVHICTFIILKLSGERAFCVALNKPFTERLPIDLPLFQGSHADLVVITLHKMVVNGGDKLAALYNCFLTIVCNLSPYAKTLSLVASVKLVNLFKLFTSPRFFYQTETNYVYVALLLEIFNNIIQYQYGGNPHLVYAIVRRKSAFEQLERLTLPTAIANAKKSTPADLPQLPNAENAIPVRTTPEKREEPVEQHESLSTGSTTSEVEQKASTTGSLLQNGGATHDSVEKSVQKETMASRGAAATGLLAAKPLPPRFTPTSEWLERVKTELPLNTITRLLQHLGPQLDELIARSEITVDEIQILDFIRNTTMVGLLPVPHAIVIRKYQPNNFTSLWFSAFLWGCLFLGNQLLPLFDGNSIKLFTVSVVS